MAAQVSHQVIPPARTCNCVYRGRITPFSTIPEGGSGCSGLHFLKATMFVVALVQLGEEDGVGAKLYTELDWLFLVRDFENLMLMVVIN